MHITPHHSASTADRGTTVSEDGSYTIPCRDSTIGRTSVATIRRGEDGRAVVIVPQPAGTFDADGVTRLIDALVETRRAMIADQQ
jgi:hypothetical protein